MKSLNSINVLQRDFVRRLRNGEMNAAEFEALLRSDQKGVTRWFRNPNFWRHVREALRAREKVMSTRIHLNGEEAQKLIAQVVAGTLQPPYSQILACEKADKQRVEDAKLQLARRRRYGRKKKLKAKAKELVHPRFAERQKELMAALRKDREVGNGCKRASMAS